MKTPRIPTNNGIPWSPSEASGINEFLNTPLGIKWLRVLFARKPKIDQTTTERAALSGVFAAGYEKLFEEISNTRARVQESESASAEPIDPTKD